MGPQEFGTWIGIGFAAVGATFAAYKKWGNVGTDIASNREETNWVNRVGKELEAERKRADEAQESERDVWAIHIADSEKIALLTAQHESCRIEVATLARQMADLRSIVWQIANAEQRKILGREFGEHP